MGVYLTPLTANIGPLVSDFEHMPAVPFAFEPGVWELGAWGIEILADYRLILDYRRQRFYIWWPGSAEQGRTEVVELPHREPELGRRLGLW